MQPKQEQSAPGHQTETKPPSASRPSWTLAWIHGLRSRTASRSKWSLVAAAQFALAWVLAQGEDIIPIPGTKRRKYLEQNAAAVDITLTPRELADLSAAFSPDAVAGLRYPAEQMPRVNI
jgi:aryl-alcohol dehydrogenase-like predicted oxidoreductase